MELVWGVNSRVFYFGVRKYVYGMPVPADLDALIEAEVDTFFDGSAAQVITALLGGEGARLSEEELDRIAQLATKKMCDAHRS